MVAFEDWPGVSAMVNMLYPADREIINCGYPSRNTSCIKKLRFDDRLVGFGVNER